MFLKLNSEILLYHDQSCLFVSAFILDFIVKDDPIQPEHSLVTNLSWKPIALKQIS